VQATLPVSVERRPSAHVVSSRFERVRQPRITADSSRPGLRSDTRPTASARRCDCRVNGVLSGGVKSISRPATRASRATNVSVTGDRRVRDGAAGLAPPVRGGAPRRGTRPDRKTWSKTKRATPWLTPHCGRSDGSRRDRGRHSGRARSAPRVEARLMAVWPEAQLLRLGVIWLRHTSERHAQSAIATSPKSRLHSGAIRSLEGLSTSVCPVRTQPSTVNQHLRRAPGRGHNRPHDAIGRLVLDCDHLPGAAQGRGGGHRRRVTHRQQGPRVLRRVGRPRRARVHQSYPRRWRVNREEPARRGISTSG
jgi:hypothetical protein